MEFTQQYGLIKRIYILQEGGLRVKTYEDDQLPEEKHFPFEVIGKERTLIIHHQKGYLLGAGLTLAGWILLITNLDRSELVLYPQVMLLGILPMVFGWLFFRNRHPRYHILTSTGVSIEFFVERDGKKVENFLEELMHKRNDYLKRKYGTVTSYDGYQEQCNNLEMLLNDDIITPEEYQDKMNRLNKMFNPQPASRMAYPYSHN